MKDLLEAIKNVLALAEDLNWQYPATDRLHVAYHDYLLKNGDDDDKILIFPGALGRITGPEPDGLKTLEGDAFCTCGHPQNKHRDADQAYCMVSSKNEVCPCSNFVAGPTEVLG